MSDECGRNAGSILGAEQMPGLANVESFWRQPEAAWIQRLEALAVRTIVHGLEPTGHEGCRLTRPATLFLTLQGCGAIARIARPAPEADTPTNQSDTLVRLPPPG
jgi:hypothetical protein